MKILKNTTKNNILVFGLQASYASKCSCRRFCSETNVRTCLPYLSSIFCNSICLAALLIPSLVRLGGSTYKYAITGNANEFLPVCFICVSLLVSFCHFAHFSYYCSSSLVAILLSFTFGMPINHDDE